MGHNESEKEDSKIGGSSTKGSHHALVGSYDLRFDPCQVQRREPEASLQTEANILQKHSHTPLYAGTYNTNSIN